MRNSSELDAAASEEVVRLLQNGREDGKPAMTRSRGGTESLSTLEVVTDSPTSAPTRCVSICIERVSMYSRESTP